MKTSKNYSIFFFFNEIFFKKIALPILEDPSFILEECSRKIVVSDNG